LITIYDPQREYFYTLGDKLVFIVNRFFNSKFSFHHGEGPRQQFGADCAITSLLCLERILKGVKLSNNSSKLVRDYKENICKILDQYAVED